MQFAAPLDVIRRALMRDRHGNASGPLGIALDLIAQDPQPPQDPEPPAETANTRDPSPPFSGSGGQLLVLSDG